MISQRALLFFSTLFALGSVACSGDVEIAKTGSGGATGSGDGTAGSTSGSSGTGACQLEATHTLGGGVSAVDIGQYCDFWYFCFASTDAANAAAARHAELDCSRSGPQGCMAACQFKLQDRALSAAELQQMCDIASESSPELVCTNLE